MPTGSDFAMMIFSPEEKVIEQAKKNFKKYYDDDEKKFKLFGVNEYNLVLKSIIENYIDKFPYFHDEDENKLKMYIDSRNSFKESKELNENAKPREKKQFIQRKTFWHLCKHLQHFI